MKMVASLSTFVISSFPRTPKFSFLSVAIGLDNPLEFILSNVEGLV